MGRDTALVEGHFRCSWIDTHRQAILKVRNRYRTYTGSRLRKNTSTPNGASGEPTEPPCKVCPAIFELYLALVVATVVILCSVARSRGAAAAALLRLAAAAGDVDEMGGVDTLARYRGLIPFELRFSSSRGLSCSVEESLDSALSCIGILGCRECRQSLTMLSSVKNNLMFVSESYLSGAFSATLGVSDSLALSSGSRMN